MYYTTTCFRFITAVGLVLVWYCLPVVAGEVSIAQHDGKATATIDGELFTEYVTAGHTKPILYPIMGPHGIEMTRHYPMKEGVDNEAHDHPHHESLWFTHDGINGVNFWSSHEKGRKGASAHIKQKSMTVDGHILRTENEWLGADDQIVLSDSRVIAFGTTPVGRYIDYQISIHASHGDVKFADTKEGTMAIRTNPLLRLKTDPKRGNHTAAGQSVNSEGVQGEAMWGKRAKWVDYWAPISGNTVGIAIFDHPTNPRHPTWWHARYYGLVAANPFGIHDFEKKPAGTGDMIVKDGTSVTFRYRFVFHEGDAKSADVENLFQEFAGD